jgi:hypothetical protein
MQDTTQVIMEELVVDVVDTTGKATEYVGVVTTGNPDQLQAYIDMLGPILYGIAIFAVLGMMFSIICYWMIFEKAGRPGWESIIPFYGLYVFFQIIGKSLWTILWNFIPVIGTVIFLVKILGAFSRSFGRGAGFAWGLAFFGIIFHAIIAFDKSIVYVGPNGVNNTPNANLDV